MKRLLVLLVTVAMAIAMVGVVPAGAGEDTTVCLVADTSGFEDGSFNELALEGAERARHRLHVDIDAREPAELSDIPLILDELVVSGHCDLIIGVGFLVGGPMEDYIVAYPDQRFATIDHAYFPPYPNAAGLLFRVDQAAFLAGYVAAGLNETGTIGTYGGADILPVLMFMDGYDLGAMYHNATHGTSIAVLRELLDFQFVDPDLGYDTTIDLFDQGADTVFAVAGPTGLGSLDAAADRKALGDRVFVIEPDFDHFTIERDPSRILLTSVLKNIDVAVYNNIAALVDGSWPTGWVWEDLESGGVDIAPFHKTRNQVSGQLNHDLKGLRDGIIDGTIPTLPYPLP